MGGGPATGLTAASTRAERTSGRMTRSTSTSDTRSKAQKTRNPAAAPMAQSWSTVSPSGSALASPAMVPSTVTPTGTIQCSRSMRARGTRKPTRRSARSSSQLGPYAQPAARKSSPARTSTAG